MSFYELAPHLPNSPSFWRYVDAVTAQGKRVHYAWEERDGMRQFIIAPADVIRFGRWLQQQEWEQEQDSGDAS